MKYLALGLLFFSTFAFATDRFVVITDSHGVGEFGGAISDWLRARPNTEFELFASGGSAPLQWTNNAFTTPCGLNENNLDPAPPRVCSKLHTPTLESLWLEQPIPIIAERKITLIVQGTNFGMKEELKEEQIRATKKLMIQALSNSDKCIWIGPPNMKRSPGYDKDGVEYKISLIKAASLLVKAKLQKECDFVDSRDFSTYPSTGDGIHYQWPGSKNKEQIQRAREWGNGAAKKVDALL